MTKKMLVDSSHQEETRVVILDGNKVEEFDYESAARRPLKGNIYLAKVTRVEPSLQACFVEYGGNRHGFLAFSEIHPDYYQIPVADRQALIEASRDEGDDADDADDLLEDGHSDETDHNAQSPIDGDTAIRGASEPSTAEGAAGDGDIVEVVSDQEQDVWIHDPETEGGDGHEGGKSSDAPAVTFSTDDLLPTAPSLDDAAPTSAIVPDDEGVSGAKPAVDDAREELPRRQHRSFRRYKIQEVIKRRQVLLIQVVKEERGNKGAALTTYLSLAGRYCVLMPNTDRGGGISRKISNVADRRKLKEMASELEVPEGMGVIIRTAGANRTKQEIRRDFEYLLRQWDSVRELTLRSSAPTLVYEEGNLIKRTIRDLFSKEVDEILVEGEQGYKEAHSFMAMLMPSHADNVIHYSDAVPLFQRYGVEAALDSMFNPIVRLRSGGYIVINQTEALVAVDVNSGKSTREHHIEDTALKTNLEAAEEIARQLRLRDLAGLVVIDFIDMEEHRNNRSVEKRLKDCLRHDRARIQLGRISPFGLLEMSRQRLRAGMIEGATTPCPHCEGRGVIRSVGSMALRVLRAVEEHCQREKMQAVTLRVPPEVAIYILNHKRAQLNSIEDRNGVYIYIESQTSLAASAYEIERGANVPFEPRKPAPSAITVESQLDSEPFEDDEEEEETASGSDTSSSRHSESRGEDEGAREEGQEGRRRRRKRRRGGRDRDREPRHSAETQAAPAPHPENERSAENHAPSSDGPGYGGESRDFEDGDAAADEGDGPYSDDAGGDQAANAQGAQGEGRRRRRRGRRGRRGRRFGEEGQNNAQNGFGIGNLPTPAEALDAPEWPATGGYATLAGDRPPAPPRRSEAFEPYSSVRTSEAPVPTEVQSRAPEVKTERASIASFFGFGQKPEPAKPEPAKSEPPQAEALPEPKATEEPVATPPTGPKRSGWWQKRS